MVSSLIIPAYVTDENLKRLTEDCIASLEDNSADEVILVDNGSTTHVNGAAVRIAQNRGYTGAVNVGMALARGDIIIVANNDMVFGEGWLDALMLVFDNGYDIAVLKTSDEADNAEPGIHPWDRLTSFWGIQRRVYEALGGLDLVFGAGAFADTDYCRRAREAGFKTGKNWDFTITHHASATFKLHPSDYDTSREHYIKKWGNLD